VTRPLRVLVACEYSGTVRDAFTAAGHSAMSCDLLESETPGLHYRGDVRDVLDGDGDGRPWDLLIAHPPCTDLAVSGARHFPAKIADGRQAAALDFVRLLLDAPVPRIAVENPVSIIATHIRPASQYVQPWQYGHPETKSTGLWLVNLPRLVPTDDVSAQMHGLPASQRHRVHMMPPGPDRWRERSRTFPGIAAAMADQWGALPPAEPRTRLSVLEETLW
jgi:site-specific DNA-cytosine methylase